jgi:hypothetical protein
MMDRRAFITMVGGSILAAPLAVGAQPASGKVYRIGFLRAPPIVTLQSLSVRDLRELEAAFAAATKEKPGPCGALVPGSRRPRHHHEFSMKQTRCPVMGNQASRTDSW